MAAWHNLIRAEACKSHVLHQVETGGVISEVRFQCVRAAASPPGEGAGAYVVVGMEMDDVLEVAPAPLVLLTEGLIESFSVDSYWDRVTDAVVGACASPLYLDLDDQAVMSTFYDYKARTNVNVDVAQSPWVDAFRLGLGVCLDYLRAGRLDLHRDSLTRKELRTIEQSTLGDKPEVRWPLVNALRFCLSGFRKYAPTKPFEPGRYSGSGVKGWMV